MGITTMIIGIVMILFTPIMLPITGMIGQSFPLFGLVTIAIPFTFLMLAIAAKKQEKSCAIAGIVLCSIPLAI